jgi:hypothetical protein
MPSTRPSSRPSSRPSTGVQQRPRGRLQRLPCLLLDCGVEPWSAGRRPAGRQRAGRCPPGGRRPSTTDHLCGRWRSPWSSSRSRRRAAACGGVRRRAAACGCQASARRRGERTAARRAHGGAASARRRGEHRQTVGTHCPGGFGQRMRRQREGGAMEARWSWRWKSGSTAGLSTPCSPRMAVRSRGCMPPPAPARAEACGSHLRRLRRRPGRAGRLPLAPCGSRCAPLAPGGSISSRLPSPPRSSSLHSGRQGRNRAARRGRTRSEPAVAVALRSPSSQGEEAATCTGSGGSRARPTGARTAV